MSSPLQLAYQRLLTLHHEALLKHGGEVASGVALAVKEVHALLSDDEQQAALVEWAEMPIPCLGGGQTISRWNQTADRSKDRPYGPGDQETCKVCGKSVDVVPQAAQLRKTGFQAVGHLVAH